MQYIRYPTNSPIVVLTPPTVQKFTSPVDLPIVFTPDPAALYLEVWCIGGGGGGGGSAAGETPSAGNPGGTLSSFNGNTTGGYLEAYSGQGGGAIQGGAGGGSDCDFPVVAEFQNGGQGSPPTVGINSLTVPGNNGGSAALGGGGGRGSYPTVLLAIAGEAGQNFGGGGASGSGTPGTSSIQYGGGGGGAYAYALFPAPFEAAGYTIFVASGGSGGSAGFHSGAPGGAGASGIVVIVTHYQ